MKILKKIIIGIVALLVLVVLANIGLNFWIEKHLPRILNEENDSPYFITYDHIDISLINSSIIAKDIVIVPKDKMVGNARKAGLYGSVSGVTVSNFKVFDILFSHKISARSIRITRPDLLLYESPEKPKPKSTKPFSKIVTVSSVFIDNGNLKTFDLNDVLTLDVSNVNVELDGILVTDDILERKIPFDFDTYSVKYDSLYFKPNPFYHVITRGMVANDSSVSVHDVSYIPEYSREAFVKAIPKEKDLFAVKIGKIDISHMDWGFKKNKFFFHSKSVILNSASANIYRAKMPPDDLTKKPLYNKLLRDIPFDLQIDTLAIRNSSLEYEEEKTFEKGAGLLTFRKFNLYARNVASGFEKSKVPDLTIDIKCLFMGTSPMNVDWRLNVLDKSDGFNIKGSIVNFPAENLTPFTKPYMNVTAKGMLEEVSFNFSGNDKMSKGEVALNYDDLKVTIYRKKDDKKKNKFLSAIANLFVKKDTKEKVTQAQIEVDRIPEKSFYNLLWRSIAEGLKKIMV